MVVRRVAAAILVLLFATQTAFSQRQYELNDGWKCISAVMLKEPPGKVSVPGYPLTGWMPAVVPGTVLTTLLHNKLIPDPNYGTNNRKIPDIYDVGRAYYTFIFTRDFDEAYPAGADKVLLTFRGINYSADIYLNGHKLNDKPDKGMFLRQSYDITPLLQRDGHNRLLVTVFPPDPVGNPNGGQGGDGMIAHSVTNQYVAGWDWIQPVHDRNTGIWDKVLIRRTKQLHVEHTHVVTHVPGKRMPAGRQAAATIRVTTEVENVDTAEVEGVVQAEIDGRKWSVKVKLAPGTMEMVELPLITLDSPSLWWPNGYGPQNLYDLTVKCFIGKTLSDEEQERVGVRELKAVWNTKTNSREIRVNGQKIFIKGGNWILSDAMLRLSSDRYDAGVRYHRDMNLNLIRVWGGGITERPEFYDACDKYGLLVMQDLWVSGDCNGRWYDPLKKEDTNARRKYPDDHDLFLASADDQIRMLRNHPSLALWCGGNEIRPPSDVLNPLRDSLLPQLDGTRFFFEYSNDDSMSLHSDDGPYTIQPDRSFWEKRSFPFNSEVGSVGIGDIRSLERFIPKEHLVPPHYDPVVKRWVVDSVWQYHKFSGYDSSVELYGHPEDAEDFAAKAQLVNYNQYRALMEGFTSHMWDWYTGVIIWKTQNPWTAMVGQMYDVYLDPNACLYGAREGAKPLHIMYDPVQWQMLVANSGLSAQQALVAQLRIYDAEGNGRLLYEGSVHPAAGKVVRVFNPGKAIDTSFGGKGIFLALMLADSVTGKLLDDNIYWLPDHNGSYEWLENMPGAGITASDVHIGSGKASVTVSDSVNSSVAFFLHVTLLDPRTRERILPCFANNNYFSVLPGERRTIEMEYVPRCKGCAEPLISIEGWNVTGMIIEKGDVDK